MENATVPETSQSRIDVEPHIPAQSKRIALCGPCAAKGAKHCEAAANDFGRQLREHRIEIEPVDRAVRPRRNVYVAGEMCDDAYVMCRGWACRVIRLAEGRRQILSYLLPGDLFSPTAPFQQSLDFFVEAITEVRYAAIDRRQLRALIASNPKALAAFADSCVAAVRSAEHKLADLGQHLADEKIVLLILQLMERLQERGLVHDQCFEFPVRQQHIADTVGLTSVHVSRVMGAFRKGGIIEAGENVLKIRKLDELRRIAGK